MRIALPPAHLAWGEAAKTFKAIGSGEKRCRSDQRQRVGKQQPLLHGARLDGGTRAMPLASKDAAQAGKSLIVTGRARAMLMAWPRDRACLARRSSAALIAHGRGSASLSEEVRERQECVRKSKTRGYTEQ